METRANAQIEIRTNQAGQKTLVGYASTFDHPYPVDMVTEIIDRKAFTRTLQEKPDVYALVGHDPARVLGRTKNGTLSLTVDERGLKCEIVPVDTQEARDVVALVESGTLDAMSFGFKVKDQKFEYRDGGVHRRIMDCELHEVSVVAFPANPDAKLSTRDRAEVRSLLRKVGYQAPPQEALPKTQRSIIVLPSLLSDIATREEKSTTAQTLYVKVAMNRQGGKPVPHELWVEDESGDVVTTLMDGYDDWQEIVELYPFMGKQNGLQNDAGSWAETLASYDIANKGDVVVTPSGKKAKVR